MRIDEIFIEGRPGRQQVTRLYHGTTSKYLASIKKQGLQPDQPAVGFGFSEPGSESLGGVYLTANRQTAEEAATEVANRHGGAPIVVTVQYVLGSGGADEDSVRFILLGAVDNANNAKDYARIATKAINAEEQMQVPQGDLWYLERYYERALEIMSNADADEVWQVDELIFEDPEIRKILANIIQKIRMGKSNLGIFSNIRVTRPITFRGKTKIIDISPA